ncbi:MAG: hypothetical protein ACJAYN_003519, partial [Bermanella sp.]
MLNTKLKLGLALAVSVALVTGCSSDKQEEKQQSVTGIDKNPFPSTYQKIDSKPIVINNVTILDGIGGKIEDGEILLQDGVIVAVGKSVRLPSGAI